MRSLLLIGAILALPATAFAQSCELKIGAMGPMSGSGAQWGLSMKSAAEMAAAEVNQAGGVKINGQTCKVSVVSYDSKYTPDGAAAGANALAGDGIHVIIGPVGSVENAAVKPVAARNKQLAWNAAYATNAEEAKYPLMFQVSPPPAVWADLVVKRAIKTFPMKKVVIVVPNDQTGTDVASVDAKAYQNNGVTASTEFYQRGTTNFAPIITRVLAVHPDAVDTASSAPSDAGVIVKQLRLAGFTGVIGRVGGPGTAEILRVCGGMDVLKDFYWYEAVPTDDPKVQALDIEFHKLLGRDPVGGTTFWSYLPGARMTMKAIQTAGTDDAEKVAAVLRKMPVEDPNIGKGYWTGKRYFGIGQTLFFPFGIGIIKDGKNLGVERQDAQPE